MSQRREGPGPDGAMSFGGGLGLERPVVPIKTFPAGSGEVAAAVGQLGDAPAACSGQTA